MKAGGLLPTRLVAATLWLACGALSCTVDERSVSTTEPLSSTAPANAANAPSDTADSGPDDGVWLRVAVSGGGRVVSDPPGVDCPGSCRARFAPAAEVRLNVTPDAGWKVSDWRGERCDGPTQTCTIATAAPESAEERAVQVSLFRQTNNFVFISSEGFATNLGSVQAYDQACNRLADGAGINTPTRDGYIAAVSSTTSRFWQRLRPEAAGWIRMDGKPFADAVGPSAVAPLVYNNIAYDERAQLVSRDEIALTGGSGLSSLDTCGDWASGAPTETFSLLRLFPSPAGLVSSGTYANCSAAPVTRLICLGNTFTAPLAFPRAPGKRVWLSNTPLVIGRDTPKSLCESSRPNGAGSAAALVATADRPAGSLIDPSADYVLPDGQLVASGATLLHLAAREPTKEFINTDRWQLGNGSYLSQGDIWTGAADMDSLTSADTTCENWTNVARLGMAGSLEAWAGNFWASELPVDCARERRVFCVEM